MYDTFHSNIEEADPVGASPTMRTALFMSTSENDRGGAGRGNIPWPETFKEIRASGYDGWLTIEAFRPRIEDLAPQPGLRAISPRPPKRSTGMDTVTFGTDGRQRPDRPGLPDYILEAPVEIACVAPLTDAWFC